MVSKTIKILERWHVPRSRFALKLSAHESDVYACHPCMFSILYVPNIFLSIYYKIFLRIVYKVDLHRLLLYIHISVYITIYRHVPLPNTYIHTYTYICVYIYLYLYLYLYLYTYAYKYT